jgi:hypothetical protein
MEFEICQNYIQSNGRLSYEVLYFVLLSHPTRNKKNLKCLYYTVSLCTSLNRNTERGGGGGGQEPPVEVRYTAL